MPLILIGLIVLIGLLILAIYNYFRSDPDDQQSPMRRGRNAGNESTDEENKVLYFPSENVEDEKKKRNLK